MKSKITDKLLTIIIAMSVIFWSTTTYANNVIIAQNQLNSTQIKWLNKHRPDQTVGQHHNFVFYREPTGYIWSISLNEYKKSKYYINNDLIGYFDSMITQLKIEETEALEDILTQAAGMLFELTDGGMPEHSAYTIVKYTFPQFSIVDGMPVITSHKMPMVSISIQ